MSVCAAWIDVEDVLDPSCGRCAALELDEGAVAEAALFASEVLWRLTGERWPGVCSDVVRPCARYSGPEPPPSTALWLEASRSWPWHPGWGWCACNREVACGCTRIPQIQLPGFPVVTVDEVLIDGAVLDPAAWRVDENRWLVRVDGEGWPCCQDLTAETDEDGTWQVSYTFGAEPPAGGQTAAAVYACEVAKWLCGSGDCLLPQRVQSITRQGVTAVLLDPAEFVSNGLTGVPLVDRWIDSVTGGKRRRRHATISSPDVPRRVRRTGSTGS